MKYLAKLVMLWLPVLFLSNCASIVSKSTYPFAVTTLPKGAKVVIQNRAKETIYTGESPVNVTLRASAGFFKKELYTVTVSSEGYEAQTKVLEFKLDGWYFGNFAFGGIIGFLIVDPATGAMYKPKVPFLTFDMVQASAQADLPQLRIYDLADIPAEWRNELIRINP